MGGWNISLGARELCVHMVRRVKVCKGKIILRDSGLVGYSAADGMDRLPYTAHNEVSMRGDR
jgi:hypothetical protein